MADRYQSGDEWALLMDMGASGEPLHYGAFFRRGGLILAGQDLAHVDHGTGEARLTDKGRREYDRRLPPPVRIQRKRTKGYNMQAESLALNGRPAVYVGRPSSWRNPYRVTNICTAAEAVEAFREIWVRAIENPLSRAALDELRGKNLACWCPLDQPCHADVLLELANRERV